MARPPTPPGMPTPTPTPRPATTGYVSPADYFSTCADNFADATKNETSLVPAEVLEWVNAVLTELRAAEQ